MRLSFVIPVYNERETIRGVVDGVLEHTHGHEIEIFLVDDGSDDGSADAIDGLAKQHGTVRVVRFSKNLGKSAALAVGFARATGDVVFTLDSDLQDDPKEVPRFLAKLEEGFDLVCGWKAIRHDPWHKTVPSRAYNWFVAKLWGLPLHDVNCGYKAMRAPVAKSIRLYDDMHRLIPVLAAEQGYRLAEIVVEHHARQYGHSKYGIERFANGAIDVLTLSFLTHGVRKPGLVLGACALVMFVLGTVLIFGGAIVFPSGWAHASFVVGTVAFVLGLAVSGIGLAAGRVTRDLDRADPSPYIVDNHNREKS